MPKTRVLYTCQQCGNEAAKWLGRCSECGAWNSYVESVRATGRTAPASGGARDVRARFGASTFERLVDVSVADVGRTTTGIAEFDRVLGGGIVPGSLILLGGDPGIGKSTLTLQAAANVAGSSGPVLYVSGEESTRQVRLRAQRLGALADDLFVLAETSLDAIVAHVEQLAPRLIVVDSIQTVFLEDVPSSPGNVSQLRECTLRLMNVAKSHHVPILLVGHVTKDGTIAGPRVLEHIVDCVLYLEGERFYSYRLLRATKNRFGSTNEVGVFEMARDGMAQVTNPSAAFLSERVTASSGSAVTVPVEGTRALLVEVQALTAPTGASAMAPARRTALGVDMNRLLLLLAVLGKRVGLPLGSQDVYVNVVAGLKIAEPAVDLGVALSVASSFADAPVPPGLVVTGEIGLLGELRPVGQLDRRLAEAARLGFDRCILPAVDLRRLTGKDRAGEGGEITADGLTLTGAATVGEALTLALGKDALRRGRGRRSTALRAGGAPGTGTDGIVNLDPDGKDGALLMAGVD
ncbi:MAG: DNA repair protein RadA [Chloroflexi bacterium]|nr:DNA repair protein RadA [Chloroflexota bacterium]